MTNHTPGPWYLDLNKNGGDWQYIIRQEASLPGIKPGLHIAELNKNLVRPETGHVEANAHLIASAPEMLETLKEALRQLTTMDPSLSHNWNASVKENAIMLLEHGINKAEGRK